MDESQLDEDAVMDVFDEGVEAELSEEVTELSEEDLEGVAGGAPLCLYCRPM